MNKICPICGKSFSGRKNQKFCKEQHYKTCEVCGKIFPITVYQCKKKTCSKECHDILCVSRAVESVKKNKIRKICKLCGKEFIAHYSFQEICNDEHYGTCVICGNKFKYSHDNYSVKTCSKLCKSKLTKQTCMDKYGVEFPLQNFEIQENCKQTCLDKYGVENPAQCEEVASRRKSTMIERYGVEYSWQSDVIRQKFNSTMKTKYGVSYALDSPEIQKKMFEHNQAKYGEDWSIQSDVVKSKIRKTCIKKYGVDNPFKSDEIKNKIKLTNLDKYGHEYAVQNEAIKSKIIESRHQSYADSLSDDEAKNNYLQFVKNPTKYIADNFDPKPTIHEVSESMDGLNLSTIYDYLSDSDSKMFLNRSRSLGELEIKSFIKFLNPSIVIYENDRTIISPKEIDLYLPEYKIGIEFNPTYTHNSSLPAFNSNNVVKYNYHQMKTDMCAEKGIFLFHIFGYEWTNKKEILQSMIRNLLGCNQNKFYGRKLHVESLNFKECSDFLKFNHRQGSCNSSIRLGLKDKDGNLVSVMTFNKLRSTIGETKFKNENTWELARFCNKLNTTVVGGASKLFHHFVKNYAFDKIVSFSDKSHTKGNLYSILGFKQISISSPGYVWVNLKSDIYFNRVNCQKKNLRKLFKDDSIDIENKTEQMIMMEHGFVQVYDSGVIRWEYSNN